MNSSEQFQPDDDCEILIVPCKGISRAEISIPKHFTFRPLKMAYLVLIGVFVLCQAGCLSTGKSPVDVEPGKAGPGTGFWGPGDIEKMAKKIGDTIAETPRLMNATRGQYVIVDKVKNQTRYDELTRSQIFTERLITELSKRKEFSEKVFFVNRERADALEEERKKKESGAVSGSADVDYAGADFLLAGKFMDAATSSGGTTQVAIDFLYILLDARRQIEVVRDSYPIRRAGTRDRSYQ